jgi:hypothetical protein
MDIMRTEQQAEHSMLGWRCKHDRTQHLENPKTQPKNPKMHPENPKTHLETPKMQQCILKTLKHSLKTLRCILIICRAAFSSRAKQATDVGQHSSFRFEKPP